MNNGNDDKNAMVYLLAGFGLGALVGAMAGLLFAPKPGSEMREELGDKIKDLKGKTEEWISEQRAKRLTVKNPEEVGA
ncbi:MAG: YtxH domain-containing protein [Chthonomonadaceae bacterium]|nr:YtxH domain-containing protein [Chthonomonadaceae bacterium]